MQQFKISDDSFNKIRKKQLVKFIPIIVIGIAFTIAVTTLKSKKEDHQTNTVAILITTPLVLAGVFFMLYRGINKQKPLFDSYTIIVDANVITRKQLNTPDMAIYFNEISEIDKTKNNTILIKGKTPAETIVVIPQIDNYSELEKLLNEIKPINQHPTVSLFQKYSKVIGILTAALMMAAFMAANKIIVGICGTLAAGIFIYSYIQIVRNPNIEDKVKRKMRIIFIPVAAIVYVTIAKITGRF